MRLITGEFGTWTCHEIERKLLEDYPTLATTPTTLPTRLASPQLTSTTSSLSSALAFSITMPVGDLAIYSRAQATGVLASSIFVGTFPITPDLPLTKN
jgi:hypothetical protein